MQIGRPRNLSINQIAANYDVFYGLPPHSSKMKFLQHAKRLFAVEQITYDINALIYIYTSTNILSQRCLVQHWCSWQ